LHTAVCAICVISACAQGCRHCRAQIPFPDGVAGQRRRIVIKLLIYARNTLHGVSMNVTAAINIGGEAKLRMYATVQINRVTSRNITPTKETSRIDVSIERQADFVNRVYQQPQEIDVNRDRLEGKWKQLSGSVREHWGRLTDDRLSIVAGRHNQAAGRVQERSGIYKEECERQLREFLHRNRDWDSSSR